MPAAAASARHAAMSALSQADPWLLAACIGALVAGGLVKGMTGIGLPLVAVPVLAALMPVPQALALIALPSMLTSVTQVFHGGRYREAWPHLWPVLVGLAIGMPSSVHMLATVDPRRLDLVLGVILFSFSLLMLKRVVVRVPPRHEVWAGMLMGLTAGLIGGVSLFVGPVLAIYIAGLAIDRHLFVATISAANLAAAALFTALIAGFGVADTADFALSGAATAIVFLGFLLGQRMRFKLDEEIFRRSLALVLLLASLNMLRKALA